ncbi:phosphotransferase [Candidatus Poribacteria bacterium]|nr:phosphotransferase [Candidatus Poribacteria bacterium]
MQQKSGFPSTDEIFTLSQLAAQIAKDAGVKEVVSIRPIHKGATYVYQINKAFILKMAAIEACEGDADCITKFCIDNFVKEYEILSHLHQYSLIPSAEVIDFGMEPRCYLLMKRFSGRVLRHVWSQLNPQKRMDICFSLGQLLGKLHRVPMETFASQAWYIPSSKWQSVMTGHIFARDYDKLSPKAQSVVQTYVQAHQVFWTSIIRRRCYTESLMIMRFSYPISKTVILSQVFVILKTRFVVIMNWIGLKSTKPLARLGI